MNTKLQGRPPKPNHPLADETVTIGAQTFKVWPDDISLIPAGRGTVAMENKDVRHLKNSLIESILNEEPRAFEKEPPMYPGSGGQKIRDLPSFRDPFFDLIDKRVRLLFMLVYNKPTVFVDDCWANIFHDRDWAMPHSHKRADAAAVLSLMPPGQELLEEQFATGQFFIADPRVPQSCPIAEGYVSDNWMPMHGHDCLIMMFPAFVTHGVTPHRGETPRISIAWNLTAEKLPGEVSHDGDMNDWKTALQRS